MAKYLVFIVLRTTYYKTGDNQAQALARADL